MTFRYHAFGLNILSQIEFPELIVSDFSEADVEIELGKVPLTIDGSNSEFSGFDLAPNKMLLRFEGVGNYLVENGNHILVEYAENHDAKDVRLFVLGSCFGALLHQRGFLALHSSGFVHNGDVVLLSGDSGAGKSSICNSFRLKGNKVITDDICAIKIEENECLAYPGFPRSKLWDDALTKLAIDKDGSSRVREELEKYNVNVMESFEQQILKIKKLYIIEPYNDTEIIIDEVEKSNKANFLVNITYRHYFLKGMGLMSQNFLNSMKFCQLIPMARLKRPKQSDISAVSAAIEDDLSTLG